jgi:hypothetical protein
MTAVIGSVDDFFLVCYYFKKHSNVSGSFLIMETRVYKSFFYFKPSGYVKQITLKSVCIVLYTYAAQVAYAVSMHRLFQNQIKIKLL